VQLAALARPREGGGRDENKPGLSAEEVMNPIGAFLHPENTSVD